MQFTCSQNLLNEAISMAQRAISPRSPQAILEGLLFEAEDNTLILTGYNLETGIECRLDADVEIPGRLVFDARMIGDIVKKLPEDLVDFSVDDQLRVTIKSGLAEFKINGLKADDYPKIPLVEAEKKIEVNQGKLKEMIQQTIFAASRDDNRPMMSGVFFKAENKQLELAAIDGFRIAIRREELETDVEATSFIVPAKSLNELQSILTNFSEDVKIYLSSNHILFESGMVKLVSRLTDGEFMDYNRIIPDTYNSQVLVDTQDILKAFERGNLISYPEGNRFPITVKSKSSNKLVISSKSHLGQVHDEISIELQGDSLDSDFNPRYFLEALKNITAEKIVMQFSGTTGPCLIKPIEGNSFLFLVLPLRR